MRTFGDRRGVVLAAAVLCGCGDSMTADTDGAGLGPGAQTGDSGEPSAPTTGAGDPTSGTGDPTSISRGDGGSTTGEGSETGEEGDETTTGGASCGDGEVDAGEACDDGNADNTDTCLDNCELASCGDGYVGPGETCDDGNDDNDDECTNDCALASCGDGSVQPGEACDDANADNTDGCLDTCAAASCGDGHVWAGHEECDDANGNDTDACVDDCRDATCGDGHVWSGQEVCDDGVNDGAYGGGGCMPDCDAPAPYCGDGIKHSADGEECDDGNIVNGDDCSNACASNIPERTVFVSSSLQTASMGGLAGADQICQDLADAAGLHGFYMAWLSDDEASPSTRFAASSNAYVLVNGAVVADDWDDLVDGIDQPINVTELGGAPPDGGPDCDTLDLSDTVGVYSNTFYHGGSFGADYSCSGWTSNAGSARVGSADDADFWSMCGIGSFCGTPTPIYCFQQ